MYWPYLTRKDIVGILLAIAILLAIFLAYLARVYWGDVPNWGFGPEWECTNPGQGEPVCVRRRSATEGTPTPSAPAAGASEVRARPNQSEPALGSP
jgi:hypothetical protein